MWGKIFGFIAGAGFAEYFTLLYKTMNGYARPLVGIGALLFVWWIIRLTRCRQTSYSVAFRDTLIVTLVLMAALVAAGAIPT